MSRLLCLLSIVLSTYCFSITEKAADPVIHLDKPRELKTLILIIASDNLQVYKELQSIWEAYMNSDPTHFEAYFVRADASLNSPYLINKNEIIIKTEESLAPGIIDKTIMSLAALQPRLDEFDYVLRTNLSSFFSYQNLLKYLNSLPRSNCYCGIAMHLTDSPDIPEEIRWLNFISGAGIILSTDLIKILLNDHSQFQKYKSTTPDDVLLGLFYLRKNVPVTVAQRWDFSTFAQWTEQNSMIEEHAYHFRAKSAFGFRNEADSHNDELLILNALLKKYYAISLPNNSKLKE